MCKDKECEILNHMRQYHKEYREKNKEKIIESKKQKYSENREVIIAKNKIYKELHKEEIQKKYSAKTTCICGGSYTYANKTKHLKTKKHLDYIAANPSPEFAAPSTSTESIDTVESTTTVTSDFTNP
jgi:hypothetical protein